MKVINCILALLLLGSSYFVRYDPLLLFTVLTTAVLALLTLFPSVRDMVMSGYALLNTLLMFFYFYRFFSAVPMLDSSWYLRPEYAPIWVVLIAAFASMHILADNSCCLKRVESSDRVC